MVTAIRYSPVLGRYGNEETGPYQGKDGLLQCEGPEVKAGSVPWGATHMTEQRSLRHCWLTCRNKSTDIPIFQNKARNVDYKGKCGQFSMWDQNITKLLKA